MRRFDGGMSLAKDELLVWSPDGVWFQYRDVDTGRVRSNWMGFQSRESVESFARVHGIAFEVRAGRSVDVVRRGGVQHVGAR